MGAAFADAGYAQHRGKQEVAANISRIAQSQQFYSRTDLGRLLPRVIHLGGMWCPRHTTVTEREARLLALNQFHLYSRLVFFLAH